MTTPLRRQYLEIKRRYPHAILFFRLGDFYETFDEDAETAARELEITLTSRPVSKNQRVPLAGIPHHALDSYLAKLIAKGYKVAICEQMEEATKGQKLVDAAGGARGYARDAGRRESAGERRQQLPRRLLARRTASRPSPTWTYRPASSPACSSTRQESGAELARLAPAELLLPRGADAAGQG